MTYYEILEVPEDASALKIYQSYVSHSIKWQKERTRFDPDFAKKQKNRMTAAFLVLTDTEFRQQYDEYLRWKRSQSQDD